MAFVSAENVKPQQIVSILKLYKTTNFDAKITAVNSKESFEFIVKDKKIILKIYRPGEGKIFNAIIWPCNENCNKCDGFNVKQVSTNKELRLSLSCPLGLVQTKIIEVKLPLEIELNKKMIDKLEESLNIFDAVHVEEL
ncbi:MAG: hypothetical protein ACP6IU_02995 [Candidatus Asgardarchaeia archaeon]